MNFVFSLSGRISSLLGSPKAASFVSLFIVIIILQVNEGRGKEFAHLPSSTSSEVVSKACKMALINYTKCNKKRTETSIKTIEEN